MAHKIVPPKFYFINIGVISVLMLLTVLFGKWDVLNLSSNPNGINLFIALAIAIMKASCIVAIFMGVAWSTKLVRVFAIGGFSWLIILFLFIMTDYVNPSADWGTPYYDAINPGVSPLPGGQDFPVTGSQMRDVKAGLEYVHPHPASDGDEGHEGEGHADSQDDGAVEDHAGEEAEGEH